LFRNQTPEIKTISIMLLLQATVL